MRVIDGRHVQAWQESRHEGAEPWAHELLYEPVDPAAYEEQLREMDALDMARLGFAIVVGTIVTSLGILVWLGWHLRGWVR